MRRSALLLFTTFLATVTGTALVGTSLLLDGSPRPTGEIAVPTLAIAAYVAAVNRVLLTGDPTALDAAVAADFVEHGPAAAFGGDRAGLGRYLRALRATYPGVRVTLEDGLASGGRISVRLAFHGQRVREFLGMMLPPTASAWTTLDLFRIDGGKVAEHWAGDAGVDLFQPLVARPGKVGIGGAVAIVIARVRPSGLAAAPLALPGAAVVVVEDGEAVARSGDAWRLVRAVDGVQEEIAAGVDATLQSGDIAVLGVDASVIRATDPRSLFVVAAAIPNRQLAATASSGPYSERTARAGDELGAALLRSPAADPAVVGGMLVERLALVHPPATAGNAAEVGLGRVVLRPGASLRLDEGGVAAVAVATGVAEVGPDDGRLVIQRAARPDNVAPPPIAIEEPVALEVGDAAVVPPGAVAELRNAGDTPAVVLVARIAPAGRFPATAAEPAATDRPVSTPTAGDEPARGGPS